jgi:hypothetical protein
LEESLGRLDSEEDLVKVYYLKKAATFLKTRKFQLVKS